MTKAANRNRKGLHHEFSFKPATTINKTIQNSANTAEAILVNKLGLAVRVPMARISKSNPIPFLPKITMACRLPFPWVMVTVAPPFFGQAHFSSRHCGSEPLSSASNDPAAATRKMPQSSYLIQGMIAMASWMTMTTRPDHHTRSSVGIPCGTGGLSSIS